MPGLNNPAGDNFQSRIAAALESVRPSRPAENSDAPASPTSSASLPGEPVSDDEHPQKATQTDADASLSTPDAGPDPEPQQQTNNAPQQPTEPIEEADDSYFDDPPPAGPAPETTQREPRESAQPVGDGNYEVLPGDCIASIALAHGLFWETVWNDPANAELKTVRRDPHVLLPGDRVHVRDRRRKEEPGATETRHRFKMRGEPCELLVTLVNEDDEPRAGESYRLRCGGPARVGVLDGSGTLREKIPSATRTAHLIVGEAPFEEHYRLKLGALDPDDSNEGVQARLRNLGYLIGRSEEDLPEQELSDFQECHDLPTSGDLDEATRERLCSEHHSVGE